MAILCIFTLSWPENYSSRGSTYNLSSELIFMFLELVEYIENLFIYSLDKQTFMFY